MSIIAFDELFQTKSTGLTNEDRLFGYDKDGVKNAAFTLAVLKAWFGGGDWNSLANKPETFAPAGHTLGSHSDTNGLDGAADGKIIGRVAGKWASVTPPWALPGDIPDVPAWVLEITATMMANWEAAYGWGDHAEAGYLTEEDIPNVPSWVLGISETEKANWNTAFGWGNHASAGYLTAETDPVFQASAAAGISLGNISVWNNKTLEYAGFADGDTPVIINGEAKISGLTAQLTENPFDPEMEEEDYLAWTPEVESFTFPVPVKGVKGVEPEDFVTKEQLDANGGVNQETKFLSGGFWIYSGTGLVFDTVRTELQFPGSNEIITVPGTRINLATFPELDNATEQQFVRPVWNRAGQVVPLFGPASSDPQVPSVSDPVTELAGDPILLGAGATSVPPVQIATGTIFAEGAAGESTLGQSGAGTSNFASTADPIAGSISAEASNVQANFTTNATPPAPVFLADFTAIAIKIRLKAPMAPGHNLGLFFRKAGAIVTKTRMLPIDRNNLGVQVLGIPLSQFESSEATVDQFVLRWYRTADATTHAGYYFDDWVLQGGVQPPPVASDGVRSVTGDGVGGTAKDVVLTFPTPAQIGAAEEDAVEQLASDLTDLENQVQDIETEVEDHEGRITELELNPGGSGADSNAVHYNAADGKSASEKQQARNNLGLDTGIPQIIDTDPSISLITRTSNLIIFTGATGERTMSGLTAGIEGEVVRFVNCRAHNVRFNPSTGVNQFLLPDFFLLLPGKILEVSYSVILGGWIPVEAGSFVLKNVPDTKYGRLFLQAIDGSVGLEIKMIDDSPTRVPIRIRNGSNAILYDFRSNGITVPGLTSGNVTGTGGLWTAKSSSTLPITTILFCRDSADNIKLEVRNGKVATVNPVEHARSAGSIDSIRRDEQLLLYPITVTTASTIHDLAETVGNFNYYLTACTEITGMSGGENGKSRITQNHSAANMIARHQNTGSIAANRYDILGGADLTIPPGGSVEWSYVAGSINRWRIKSKNF